jgi:IclR family transcriptional regulator, pca regulon regulatory protein
MPRIRTTNPPASSESNGERWSVPSLREPRYSQSLERGLAILSCFTPERPVLGIADLADELGMSRSTTHRYVITLVALGYLEQGASRKYRLGLRVTDLGMSALNSTGLREQARPHLEELRRRTSYTTSIAVLDGTEIVYVDRVLGYRRGAETELNLRTGSRLPAYRTAMGKVLLANLPEQEQRDVIAEIELVRGDHNAISSKRALRTELDQVHEDGLAVNDEELTPGLCAIAAPVRLENREVRAAVSLSAPSSMISLDQLVGALGPHLLATADSISAQLGYRREDEQPGPRAGAASA